MSVMRRVARLFRTEGEMTTVPAGHKARDFSLKGLDGKAYSLAELLKHGSVVAAFFKVSCPVCQFTFPFVERLHKQFGGDGITILGISQDDASATKDFARKLGITFPIALDEKGYPASNAYGLSMVPTIFLIDTGSTVKISSMGFVKYDLEKIASELADRRHMPRAPLFQPNESVPANRPG
jgi:peroxiredoxin